MRLPRSHLPVLDISNNNNSNYDKCEGGSNVHCPVIDFLNVCTYQELLRTS